jgi:hypothetical protein
MSHLAASREKPRWSCDLQLDPAPSTGPFDAGSIVNVGPPLAAGLPSNGSTLGTFPERRQLKRQVEPSEEYSRMLLPVLDWPPKLLASGNPAGGELASLLSKVELTMFSRDNIE